MTVVVPRHHHHLLHSRCPPYHRRRHQTTMIPTRNITRMTQTMSLSLSLRMCRHHHHHLPQHHHRHLLPRHCHLQHRCHLQRRCRPSRPLPSSCLPHRRRPEHSPLWPRVVGLGRRRRRRAPRLRPASVGHSGTMRFGAFWHDALIPTCTKLSRDTCLAPRKPVLQPPELPLRKRGVRSVGRGGGGGKNV